MPPDAAAGPW